MLSSVRDVMQHMWNATPLEWAMIAGIMGVALACRSVDGRR
jgi:hypothetical protein